MKKYGVTNFNAQQLQNELHNRQATASVNDRWSVIRSHVCRDKHGTVITCPARRIEPHDVINMHTSGKICYLDQAHAEATAAGLRRLGLTELHAYECPRSRTVHWHLTERAE
jgi:hypothetical protein